MKLLSNPEFVAKSPLIAAALLEWANISQLWRMWHERTAAGQSLAAWISVQLALWVWNNYYRVILPGDKIARATTWVGCALNFAVIATVLYFRYVVGR